jgi:hypothetical protein
MQDCLFDNFPVGQHKIKLIIEDDAQTDAFTARLRRAQKIVRWHVPEGVSLVDELIAERNIEYIRPSVTD